MLFPIFFAFVGLGRQEPIMLKYQPPIGKSYQYQFTMGFTMKLPESLGGSKSPMSFQGGTDITFKALSRTGDSTTIAASTGPMKFSMSNAPGGQAPFDNNARKAQHLQFVIDSRYGMKGAEFSKMLAGGLFGGAPEVFPDHPVGVGDTWTSSFDISKMFGQSGGPAAPAIPIKFQLESVSKSGTGTFARIKTSIIGDVALPGAGAAGKMHIDAAGAMTVDVATGVTTVQHMSLKGTITAQQMQITMNVEQGMALE